ncbi:MAG: IS21 family transposase [Spartobacteria bacterium]|nr:IS21 family transposase [Spartobacteria bacterium]
MLTVDQHAAIRHAFYHQGKSIRAIARELQLARQTVRKALQDPAPPTYTPTRRRAAPKLDAFRERIAALVEERNHQPRKQRYTSRRIYQLLVQEGYTGSESRVRGYLGELKRTQLRPKRFLPLAFDPGQDAQVDWGEAQVVLNGTRVTVHLFTMRLCYAHRTFAMAFPTERQEAFFSGHVHAFAFFAGVPHRLSYDNLTTAIKPVFTGRTRTERQAFTAFRSYYLFESHFCNRNAGHEKGQIEHGVGYVRRNALVPVPQVADYQALNDQLLAWCHTEDARQVHGQPQTIGTMWAEEQPLLRPLPPQPYPCCITTQAILTPYCQVVFETNRYSVPADQAVRQLVIRAFPFHVDILDRDQILARHPRSYLREQDIVDPLHYLPLLLERPGAFDHAKPLRRWRETWPPVYRQILAHLREHWPDGRGIREFVRILQLHQDYPAAQIEQAVSRALTLGCAHADGVRLCLHAIVQPETSPPLLDLQERPHLAAIGSQPLDLRVYDALFEGEV